MQELGQVTTVLAFFVSAFGLVGHVAGLSTGSDRWLASGRRAVVLTALLIVFASLALIGAFLVDDFSIRYVAQNSERNMSPMYKVAGLWAGLEGSLLFWVLILAVATIIILACYKCEERGLVPYAMVVLLATMAFFSFMVAFVSNPFVATATPPADGAGLNPLLRNPGMILHPVALYLGYVGFSVPFAYALAALWLRRTDDAWFRATRYWTMLAWLFLSLGIIWGGQWAYMELGWGGLWAWDPVENASLLPWLLATAFFHSLMIQERRGMFRAWNVLLVVFTFLATVFGTFLTRSGVLVSVHAFSQSDIGPYFLFFLGLALGGSLYLFFDRADTLRDERNVESLLSRESSFLANNVLLVGAAFAVFWGTVFPLISRMLAGREVVLGPPFFNRVISPLGIALMVLMGVCPLIAWRRASWRNFLRNFALPLAGAVIIAGALAALGIRRAGPLLAFSGAGFVILTILAEVVRGATVRARLKGRPWPVAAWELFNRHPRRYGGYLVHLAVVLIIVGVTGYTAYQETAQVTVGTGETMRIGGYTLVYDGLKEARSGGVPVVYAPLRVEKAGRVLGELRPEKRFYPRFAEGMGPTTEAAVHATATHDLYVVLSSWSEFGAQATFRLVINPLMSWIWVGTYLLTAGTLFALWPRSRVVAAPGS